MSQSSAAASLVRVSVSSGTRRADLGVPGGIPVVEIVPELARELGVLDAEQASHGFRLVAGGGTLLDPDRSFAAQGVGDGAVLSLEVVDPSTDKVYDDVVEAVADVVETQFAPWTARHSAGTAVGASVVFFLCAAWALFTARDTGALVAAVALAVALLLVGAAAVLHTRAQTGGALALALTALAYAATAGSALSPADPLWGRGLVWVGAAVAVVGLAAALAVPRHRLVLAAGVLVGVAAT
ncbi:MAG: EsaB/YukD family protein, partial [Micrococcales bacterium]|nr:EsaB/YukD family protein [Micrococcales bacterium]